MRNYEEIVCNNLYLFQEMLSDIGDFCDYSVCVKYEYRCVNEEYSSSTYLFKFFCKIEQLKKDIIFDTQIDLDNYDLWDLEDHDELAGDLFDFVIESINGYIEDLED